MSFVISLFRNKFLKLFFLYILIFGFFDYFFGNKVIDLLYKKNLLSNPQVQLEKIQEKEKEYRIKHDFFHHTLKESVNVTSQWGPYIYKICTDKNGFRDICEKKQKYEKNIILIGDSFTEGIGLNYEKTFGGMITKEWEVNVNNMSVASYSPIIYKKKIQYYLDSIIHVDHVVVFIDISDIDDENNYFLCKDNNSVCAKSDNLKINNEKNKKIKNKFLKLKKIKQVIKSTKRKIIPNNHIYEKEFKRSSWTYLKNDKIVINGINKSLKNMNELYIYLNKKKIPLSLAVYPWPGQILYDKKNSKHVNIWSEFCENKCENFINLFPLFFDEISNNNRKEIVEKYYLKNDVHFNELAHKKISNKLNNFQFY